MTPEERKRRFEAARTRQLAARTRIQRDTHAEIIRLLELSHARIAAQLAALPTEFQQFLLPKTQRAIRATLSEFSQAAADQLSAAADESWQAGIALVDAPLAAAGLEIASVLPDIDARQLRAMRSFMTDRMQDVGVQLANRINTELGLVITGVQSTGDAIQAVEGLLESGGRSRAITVVRNGLGAAFSVATQERISQAATIVPGVKKQWRRSGKLHSREAHDAADGQVVEANEPFIVNGIPLMHPKDPAGPLAEIINCGCESIPWKEDWTVEFTGKKPFTPAELAADPRKRERATSPRVADILARGKTR